MRAEPYVHLDFNEVGVKIPYTEALCVLKSMV